MTWSSRIFHEPLPRDDRNRDIFPLPLLAGPRDGRVGACRAVARRVARRRRITEQVNMAILALNSMFFGGEGGGFQKTVSDVSSLPLCQRETIRSLVKDVQSFGAPPPSASRSGALVALRASSSGFGEPEAGVGDVVGIRLDRLSLPSGRVAGVDLGESLEDPLRTMVTDYESWMLKDADEWQSISDEAVRFKCYDDPILADRRSYLDFLRHLHRCGILGLTDGVQGRVGVFAVSKKPKVENGVIKERQRLILDCRGVNMRFKDPPRSELGSLAALTELELPDGQNLFVAGADIQDCFYAAKLPGDLQSFFCLAHDLDRDEACNIFGDDFVQHSDLQSFSPCINVLPMGFSWSFYIIQQLHEQSVRRSLGIPREDVILNGYPAPQLSGDKVVAMPYCDNCHSLALSAEGCEEGKKRMCEDLEGMGFSLHEQVGFPTLGGVIDGVDGSIRPTSTRAWNILYAFEYLLDHRVEYKVVQRLLGHAMFLCVLHRGGMSIFRHLYDFVEARGEPRFLNNSEKREVENFIGVVPLLYGSLRRPWSTTVTATDASPEGFGICERELPESDIRHVGRWQEKWRFRHLPPELWRPRQRAMQGQDVFSNIDTARGGVVEQELEDIFWEDPNFPEVPHKIMSPSSWKTVKFGKWKNTNESITIKEGRALVLAVRRLCRSSGSRHKRHLFFVDNLSLAFSVGKGRASNYSLLRINQQLSALTLAGHFTLRVRWVASELNVADGPSRGQLKPGAYQACASSKGPTEADLSYIDPKGGAESRDEELSSPSTSKILEGGITEGGEEECSPSTQGVLKTECREDSETNHREDGDRSERGGAVGSQKAIDFSGAEINFFGRGRSVQGVLQEVREFLPGVKASKPTSSTNGQSYGRFHGHPFHGRKDSERGRKNLGKRGVQAHRVEGQHVEKQKGLEGMEKRKTSGESLTHSCFGGEWHCNDPSPPESAVDGSQGPSRFRHMRPGESIDIRARQVVPPVVGAGPQYLWYHVVIREFQEGRPDKIGVFDNSVALDHPQRSWLGEVLFGHSKTVNSKDDFLFQFKMEEYRHAFSMAGESLGISGLQPYQLRHGGAAEDLNSKTREYSSVKARGRWMTDQSVRRYTKVGKLQALMTQLSPANLEYCRWCQRNMEKVIRGLIPPKGPWMLFSKMCLQISVCLEDFLWSFSRERLASQKKCVVKVSIHIPLIFACMNITMSWIQTLSIVFSTGSEAVVSVSSGWACHAQVFHGLVSGMVWVQVLFVVIHVCGGFHLLATMIRERLTLVTEFCCLQFDFCGFVNNMVFHMFWKTHHPVELGWCLRLELLQIDIHHFLLNWIIVNTMSRGKNLLRWCTISLI